MDNGNGRDGRGRDGRDGKDLTGPGWKVFSRPLCKAVFVSAGNVRLVKVDGYTDNFFLQPLADNNRRKLSWAITHGGSGSDIVPGKLECTSPENAVKELLKRLHELGADRFGKMYHNRPAVMSVFQSEQAVKVYVDPFLPVDQLIHKYDVDVPIYGNVNEDDGGTGKGLSDKEQSNINNGSYSFLKDGSNGNKRKKKKKAGNVRSGSIFQSYSSDRGNKRKKKKATKGPAKHNSKKIRGKGFNR